MAKQQLNDKNDKYHKIMKRDLRQLHKEFMEEAEFVKKLSSVTLRGYQTTFDLLLKLTPAITLDLICPGLMTKFFEHLEKRRRIVGRNTIKIGIKKSTAATYRNKLNTFFEWLRIKNYLKENPFSKMSYPSVSYEDKKWLKKDDLEKITAAITTSSKNPFLIKRNLAIFFTFLYCGLRRNELVNLRVFDIDFENNTLFVNSETSKAKRNRTVPLNSALLPHLKGYIKERNNKSNATQYLFISSNHDNKLTRDGLKHLVEKWKSTSKVKFHLHQFRHTYAVNLLGSGSDIRKIQQLLGHKDIRMTAAYERCLPTKALRVDVEKLNLQDML